MGSEARRSRPYARCPLSPSPRASSRRSQKGSKLEFEASGKLKKTSVAAAQRGTTVSVEGLFHNLPVRRRELERNIKREYNKVVGLLNQYACVQTGLKFTVSQQPNKGKRMVLFSTKGNPTTRENIVNVFGAKTMSALIKLDLKLELEPTNDPKLGADANGDTKEIRIVGHVSRPTHGEGRQTPDRQMFYVNGRPCGLPQFAKVFNEVYRSYNSTQSPFIFADIRLDTDLYDVNVSPDKRTILLHDQGRMLDNMRESLIELFETQDVTVPVSRPSAAKQNSFRKPVVDRQDTQGFIPGHSARSTTAGDKTPTPRRSPGDPEGDHSEEESDDAEYRPTQQVSQSFDSSTRGSGGLNLISRWAQPKADTRPKSITRAEESVGRSKKDDASISHGTEKDQSESDEESMVVDQDEVEDGHSTKGDTPPTKTDEETRPRGREQRIKDFHSRLAELETRTPGTSHDKDGHGHDSDVDQSLLAEEPIPALAMLSRPPEPRLSQVSVGRPPKRTPQEVAVITIGDHTVTSAIGPASKRHKLAGSPPKPASSKNPNAKGSKAPLPSFGGHLTQMFAAAGSTQQSASGNPDADDEDASVIECSASEGESEEENEKRGSQEESVEEDEERDESVQDSEDDELRGDEASSERAGSPANNLIPGDGNGDGQADQGAAEESDPDFAQENEEQRDEEVEEQAETTAADERPNEPTEESQRRSNVFLKGAKKKDSSFQLLQRLKTDESLLRKQVAQWQKFTRNSISDNRGGGVVEDLAAEDAEEKLSLIISKADFGKMKIVGQFNLGFIIAVLEAHDGSESKESGSKDDELFIIDQHASDEKFNFERLQASTVVQSQRLVQPKTLELTAVEEEIIIEDQAALETNGFIVKVDTSGAKPVGSRCQLLSLPLSRETTFSLQDLEELISLLADNPTSSASTVPRPSKVRKMFAMRACRSSIMIGTALSQRQMQKVVRHMGEMEKPWNCPHGRPTMRHLCGLGAWDEKGWLNDRVGHHGPSRTDWAAYVRSKK